MTTPHTYAATQAYTPGAATNAIIQIAAPALRPVELLRLEIGQVTDAASAMVEIELDVSTAGITGWTPVTITPKGLSAADGAAASTVTAYSSGTSVVGTGNTAVLTWGINVLAGLLYLPIPEERLIIAAAGFCSVRFVTAPPASTVFTVNLVFRELG